MKLTFLGATETVTGSKYLLETASKKYLIDCGLFQGARDLREKNWQAFPVDPKSIDAVILTHAHLDHSGYLPLLVKSGFRGKIHCTKGTRDLCKILLPDSGKIQEEEAQYANKKRYSKHMPALPLYTQADAQASLEFFESHGFEEEIQIGDLKVTFHLAGHIIGASFLEITDGVKKIVFSGDLGRPQDLVMLPPKPLEKADFLVVESTYGNREHDPEDSLSQLEKVINHVIQRKGVIVVPAFSVGRSQSLLFSIYELRRQRRISEFPVYLNSPMSVNATHIFCEHLGEHRLTPEQCMGMCEISTYVNSAEASEALNHKRGPMLIISASGMATGGRVLHHLKAFLPGKENLVLLVGYQASGTRGAALLQGVQSVKIHGEEILVRAEVASIQNLSAHVDQKEMIAWLSTLKAKPRAVFVTHGEPEGAQGLKAAIETNLGWRANVPKYGEVFDLESGL